MFATALNQAGIPFYRQPLLNLESENERANLIVEMGPKPVEFLFVGHVDTVALSEEEDIVAQIEGDTLYGLGAADMKSGCAAMIEALTAIKRSQVPLKRGLRVALVVGEEETSDGAEALDEAMMAPLTVIGEPTTLLPCLNHFGYFECRLMTGGVRAHAALPEVGANAIHAMLSWMLEILNHAHKLPYPDRVAINPHEIKGGASAFVTAEECEALLDVHLPPNADPQPVWNLIQQTRDVVDKSHGGCKFDFEQIFWQAGYIIEQKDERLHPLRRAFEQLNKEWKPGVFRSHSDANLLHEKGTLPVICGPGDLAMAHTRNESVSLEQVQKAAELYTAIVYEACIQTND